MGRKVIEESLNQYGKTWASGKYSYAGMNIPEEINHLERYQGFVSNTPTCFERSHLEGHVTASALICDHNLEKVLLMHHKKLDKWLQMGGHADGHPIPSEVAAKEAEEESGLTGLKFLSVDRQLTSVGSDSELAPFDLDIHLIPERKGEPSHYHYDIRYLLMAPEGQKAVKNHESNGLEWFSLQEARTITDERSMLRQFDKLDYIRTQ